MGKLPVWCINYAFQNDKHEDLISDTCNLCVMVLLSVYFLESLYNVGIYGSRCLPFHFCLKISNSDILKKSSIQVYIMLYSLNVRAKPQIFYIFYPSGTIIIGHTSGGPPAVLLSLLFSWHFKLIYIHCKGITKFLHVDSCTSGVCSHNIVVCYTDWNCI